MEEENKKENNENYVQEGQEEMVKKIELDETIDRLKRVMAEFENYKKRSNKEREFLYDSLVTEIIGAFLPILDNLEKAIVAQTEDKNYKAGIELLQKQFEEVFAKYNVEKIETVGKTFDPELHEAVSSIQDETKGEKEITQEFRAGYKIHAKVIRHAMVVVAN